MIRRTPRGRSLSLRGRLLLITLALLAAGLTVSGAVAVATLRAHLIERVDLQLGPMATLLSRVPALMVTAPLPGQNRVPLSALPGMDLIDQVYLAYLRADGTVEQEGGPWLRGRGPELPRLDAAAVRRLGGRPFDARDDHGAAWRVVAVPLAAPGSTPPRPVASGQTPDEPAGSAAQAATTESGTIGGGTVVVAASLGGVRSTVGRLTLVCAATAAALLTSLAVIGWFAVRRGLRPLRAIERTAAAIAAGDLSKRVPVPAAPHTEIGRLAAALNTMLAQLEAAFAGRERSQARMRRFVADASHELRTPLFGIKGFAELHRMGGLPDVDHTLGRIESEAVRLVRLVEDLLLLARLDEGDDALPMDLAPMDLRTLAADALHDLRALDPGRTVTLTGPDGGPAGAAPVRGDEARLRQVVSNLVGNAVAHTPPGTPVRIGVGTVHSSTGDSSTGDSGTGGAEGVLVIADEGPGLPPEEAERVFDRFYRVDGSRSRGGAGGAGLGLAIVRSIVAAHGGRVELRTTPGAGAAFRVALPIHPASPLKSSPASDASASPTGERRPRPASR
ncbi:sensor histidine kinase [Microbispora amethystogenes]|uniref:histidine kinase n=1 Tax=Microbispora amethystogenes TaxID=1427754 RepID=A0ABQ4FB83_9ACTN|nr:HAMP domain-containing sensor histidine kinase [Microbispora amethystogenes]GIH32063.1 two-component sensor histidine kinase [Microbispora amethystogenes]